MPRIDPQVVESNKRNLRLLRADFHERQGDIRDMYRQKMRLLRGVCGKIRKIEAELIDAEETLRPNSLMPRRLLFFRNLLIGIKCCTGKF